jgi:hypothetical protein
MLVREFLESHGDLFVAQIVAVPAPVDEIEVVSLRGLLNVVTSYREADALEEREVSLLEGGEIFSEDRREGIGHRGGSILELRANTGAG